MIRKLEQADASAPDNRLLSTEWIKKKVTETIVDDVSTIKKTKYVKDAIACSAVNEIVLAHSPLPDLLTIDTSNASPKILTIIEVLKLCGSSPILQRDFCCIMFVERQKTAIALAELLKRVPELNTWLKPEWIIGHNTDQGVGMDPKAQAATLARFGVPGSTNLLIATNVAEEGLDISPCNCVIRFDLFAHHTGYLQSKGRARRNHSRFIVLLEKGNASHYNLIRKVATTDKEIEDCLKRLPEDQGAIASMEVNEGEEGDEEDLDDYTSQLTIASRTTGACIRPSDCISLVCYYVNLLCVDEFSLAQPEFFQRQESTSGYQIQLRFPANAKIRLVEGPWCSSKKKARRLACFEACKQLYALGELDENLLPRRIPKIPTPRAALYSRRKNRRGAAGHINVVQRKTPRVYGIGIPRAEFIQGPLTLHALILDTRGIFPEECATQPILLLFPSPVASMPAVELFLGSTKVVPATRSSVEVRLSETEAKQASLYSYRMLCLIGRQDFVGTSIPYLVLPTLSAYDIEHIGKELINWDEVQRSASPLSVRLEKSPLDDTESTKDMLVFEHKGVLSQRLYEVLAVCRDEVVEGVGGESRQSRAQEPCEGLWGPDEPSLQCRAIVKQGNLLDHLTERDPSKRNVLATRSLRNVSVVACSASFYRSCTLLPSILLRYDQVFLARQLNEELFDNMITEEHLVEALTVPEAMQSFDYQTLEFFGDCCLKLLACCWAFSKCDSHQEGDLHVECASRISNSALLKIAVGKGVATYATSQTFTIKTWCPPILLLGQSSRGGEEDGESSSREMRLSDKTMADLIEAILGAAMASSPALDLGKVGSCAQSMGILGDSVYTKLEDFQTMFRDIVQPKEIGGAWQDRVELGTLVRLQDTLQYIFRSPHLALEAVTHSSLLTSNLPSYERLEFLGDAVLDFLVVDLFKGKYKGLDEGGYTMMKQNATNNASLSVLCVESPLQLHSFLLHGSGAISKSVAAYKEELAKAKRDAAVKDSDSDSDDDPPHQPGAHELLPHWLDLKGPKILADIVESMLGAIFVDSGFDIAKTKEYFDKFYRSHFESYFRPESVVLRTCWDFLQFVEYRHCTAWDLVLEDHDEESVLCSLAIHDVVIARRLSRGEKARYIRENCKQELDAARRGVEPWDALLPKDGNEVAAIKTVLQQCLPSDFIRDSDKISMAVEDGRVVHDDFRVQNRVSVLQSLCNCQGTSTVAR
jgi:endoribonuclease Dicer